MNEEEYKTFTGRHWNGRFKQVEADMKSRSDLQRCVALQEIRFCVLYELVDVYDRGLRNAPQAYELREIIKGLNAAIEPLAFDL